MTNEPERAAPEAPETETSETETPETETPEPGANEPEDTELLDHSEELIDDARNAVRDALPEQTGDDDLEGPSTSEGLPADEPVTPGPN